MTGAKINRRSLTSLTRVAIVLLASLGLAFSSVLVSLGEKAEAITPGATLLNVDKSPGWCYNATDIPTTEDFYKNEVAKKGSWKKWTVAKGSWDQDRYPNSELTDLKVQLNGGSRPSSALWIYHGGASSGRYERIPASKYSVSYDRANGYTTVTFKTALPKTADNHDIYVAVSGTGNCGADSKVNLYGPKGKQDSSGNTGERAANSSASSSKEVTKEVRLEDDAYGAPKCRDVTRTTTQRLFKFWKDSSSNEIDGIKVSYPSSVGSRLNKSAVSVRYAYASYSSGRDFDVEVNGNNVYLKFRQPLVYNVGGQLQIDMPGMAGSSCPQVSAWAGVDAPPNQGNVCKSRIHPEDPSSVRNTTQSGRQPARELSPQETSEGSRSYVITSEPKTRDRYKSQLWYQPAGGGEFIRIGAQTGWVYNALAYNPQDNWLYAISQTRNGSGTQEKEDPCFPSAHLLQINPLTGEVFDLGLVALRRGSSSSAFEDKDRYGGINAGVISANGTYVVSNSSTSGTRKLYKVAIPAVKSTGSTAEKTAMVSYSEDYSVTTGADDYIWGIRSTASGTPDNLERINIRTGKVDTVNLRSLKTDSGEPFPQGKNWGKSWTYGNGNFGFGTGSTGANTISIQIQVKNPTASLSLSNIKLIAVNKNAPASFNTDGASYLGSPVTPDLKVKKTFGGMKNGKANWKIKVSNEGKGGSSGFTLNDNLPKGYTIDNPKRDITVEDTTGDGIPRVVDYDVSTNRGNQGNDQIQVLVGSVPDGREVTISVTATPPVGSIEQCVTNTVTITPNEKDPVVDNNVSTADCGLEFEKKAIDIHGTEAGIEVGDSHVIKKLDGAGYRTVRFDLIVKNPGIAELPYTLTDQPGFTRDVAPKFVVLKEKNAPGDGASQIRDAAQFAYPGDIPVSSIVNQYIRKQNPVPGRRDQIMIAPGAKHYFELEYYYVMNPESKNTATKIWDHLQCVGKKGSGKPGEGLYNKATLRDVTNQKNILDEDCVPIEQPKNAKVTLKKVDASHTERELNGAQFKIRPVSLTNPDSFGEAIQPTDGTYDLSEGTYILSETKAPAGYSLLPGPVYVNIVRSNDDFTIQLGESYTTPAGKREIAWTKVGQPLPLVSVEKSQRESQTIFTIQIADVTTGELPVTGGTGILPLMATAGLIALASLVTTRKRWTSQH
ncbi:DUF6923 family protein [Arcanobacterium canis]